MENVSLELLPKDGGRIMDELALGHMVIARSKNEFLYILKGNESYQLFTHIPGSPGANRKTVMDDEKNSAVIRKLADLSDHLYKAEFDKALDIYGVMSSAEEGILSLFPTEGGESDGQIDFVFPGRK